MRPSNKVHQASPTARVNALMQKLASLQNSNRLAIHMVERNDHYFTPDPTTLGYLRDTSAADIPQKLRAYDPDNFLTHIPLFSSSLLPSETSDWSMVPYLVCPNYMNNYGYLLNMTQQADSPPSPRVMRVEPTDFSSGMDYTNKDFKLDRETPAAIKAVYRAIYDAANLPMNSSEIDKKTCIIHAMSGPHGVDYANQQLDLLAATPHKRFGVNDDSNEYGKNIAHWNEVISTQCEEQVAAITVPIFQTLANRNPAYVAACKLQAALVGLAHIEQGYNWPVVLYHVSDPNKGQCSYVGQSRAELKHVALEALETLGKLNIDVSKKESFCIRNRALPQLTVLHAAIKEYLGVDVGVSRSGSENWQQQVHDRLLSFAPITQPTPSSPAPRSHRTSPESGGRC